MDWCGAGCEQVGRGSLMWTRWWSFGFRKGRRTSRLSEELFAFQKGVFSVVLVSWLVILGYLLEQPSMTSTVNIAGWVALWSGLISEWNKQVLWDGQWTEETAVNVAGKLTVFCSRAASVLLLCCSPIFYEMPQNRAKVWKNVLFDVVSSLAMPASLQCPV